MGMGRRAPGRSQLVRGGRHQRARRRRGSTAGAGARRADRPPGAAAVGAKPLRRLGRRGPQPGRRAGPPRRARTCPTSPSPWPAAASTASRWPPSVHDREHAVTVLRAAEHDNVFVGESADGPDNAESDRGAGSFSCSPGRALSTSGWPGGSTTPSRSSPSTSTPAPRDSATRWASTCTPRYSADAATDLERIDRSQPALFTVEYALAKLVETYGVRAGAYIGLQHRRIHRGHPGRGVRPRDGDQDGVAACPPDA